MRIWHESLIPKLCRNHLLGMWRESWGCYKIVTGEVDGGSYRNHPATKEFIDAPTRLYERLQAVRDEMLKRGYHPKCLETPKTYLKHTWLGNDETLKEWQTLSEQIAILKAKGCECRV